LQVNVLRALVGLLQQQSNLSGLGEAGNTNKEILEKLLSEVRETNLRISSLDRILRDDANQSLTRQSYLPDDDLHVGHVQEKRATVNGITFDAINQNATQRNGRAWRQAGFTVDDHTSWNAYGTQWMAHGAAICTPDFVEKFRPSDADLEEALDVANQSSLQTNALMTHRAMRLDLIEDSAVFPRFALIATVFFILVCVIVIIA
jgi:hypothetical protein